MRFFSITRIRAAALGGLMLGLLGAAFAGPRVQPARDYFSGAQLALALAIEQGLVDDVRIQARALGTAQLNAGGAREMTLLFFAIQNAFGEKPQQLQIITELVRAGAAPLQRVKDLGSPLGVVLRARSPLYVQAFLEGGVSPNSSDGSTPILFDTASEHTAAALKLLLDRGADPNKKDSLGNTAMMKALTGIQLDQVVYLLERGASPAFVNINGVSFAGQLQFQMGRQQADSPAMRKLEEIRRRIVALGVAWPPPSRDEERARMRARGQEPDKLLPVR
jgi:hypothetical protein